MALKMGNGVKVEWTIKENFLWDVGNFLGVIT